MISRKFSGLSILLIFAMLISTFSAFVAVMPAAPVQAQATTASITSPTTAAYAMVAPGGSVTVNFTVDVAGDPYAIAIGGTVGTATGTVTSTSMSVPVTISGAATAAAYSVVLTVGSVLSPVTSTSSVYVVTGSDNITNPIFGSPATVSTAGGSIPVYFNYAASASASYTLSVSGTAISTPGTAYASLGGYLNSTNLTIPSGTPASTYTLSLQIGSLSAVTSPNSLIVASQPTIQASTIYSQNNIYNNNPAYVNQSGIVNITVTNPAGSSQTTVTAYMQQGSNPQIAGSPGPLPAAGQVTLSLPVSGAAIGYYNVWVQTEAGVKSNVVSQAVYVDITPPIVSVYSSSLCWAVGTQQTITVVPTVPGAPNEKFQSITITIPGYTPIQLSNVSQTATPVPFTPTQAGQFQISVVGTDYANNPSVQTYFPTGNSQINVMGTNSVYPTGVTLPGNPGPFTGGAVYNLQLNFSNSGGSSFYYLMALNRGDGTAENITAGWVTASSNPLPYSWTVPNDVNSSNASITIWSKDCAGNISAGITTGSFTINTTGAISVTVTSPSPGTTWYSRTNENITWTVNDPFSSATHTCLLSYSTSDNSTWPYPYPVTLTSSGNSGNSYWGTWNIPPTLSGTNIEIVVEAQGTLINPGYGYSGVFYVTQLTTQPTITITPFTGLPWSAGTTQSIQWSTSGTAGVPMDYKVYLLSNGAIVVDSALSSSLDGSIATRLNQAQGTTTISWNIPTSYPSTNWPGPYKIRIVASYYVGPGPQEQVPAQMDSPVFGITPATTPCASFSYGILLYPGWNFISPQVIPVNTDINSMLASVQPYVISVWYYSASTGWVSFVPATGSGTLTSIADGKGYWIQMAQNTPSAGVNMTFQGRICPCGTSAPVSYAYTAGWNMLGFKSSVPQLVSAYMPGTCGSAQYAMPIVGYNGQTQQGTSLACTENMQPGSGYWVYFGVAVGIIPGCK